MHFNVPVLDKTQSTSNSTQNTLEEEMAHYGILNDARVTEPAEDIRVHISTG